MCKTFKSWWYWNVRSKLDTVDIIAVFWLPVMTVICIWAIWSGADKADKFAEQCQEKNGVVLQGQNGYVCLDKNLIK